MPDEQIEQWADVFNSEENPYRLALSNGFGGQDFSRNQLIKLLRYMRDNEPSIDGLIGCIAEMAVHE